MLRVRPILYTSHSDAYAALFLALGLSLADDGGAGRLFNSGQGKVGLHHAAPGSPEDGTTALGFELRDAEIFVRRTLEDGTAAQLIDAGHGPSASPSAKVTAPDGFTFLADPVTDLSLPIPAATSTLTVLQLWHTNNPVAAQKVLADIGAKLVAAPDTAGGALFRAKNGGLTATRLAAGNAVELAFAYSGDIAGLAAELTAKGVSAERRGTTLLLSAPESVEASIRVIVPGAGGPLEGFMG